MPRPKVDVDAKRKELLDIAEQLVDRYGPNKITMQDISAACGMSQSNIYRYFSRKDDLLASLADRWFDEIESELSGVMAQEGSPVEIFDHFVRTQFELKRARYDQNPSLFMNYLALAATTPQSVAAHVTKLRTWLRQLVVRCSPEATEQMVCLVEDMTIKFRDPHLISAHRAECTDERVDAVLDAVHEILKRN